MINQEKVDLSQYENQLVSATLASDGVISGKVTKFNESLYQIDDYRFSSDGRYNNYPEGSWSLLDIVSIEPVQTTEREPKCRAESGVKLKIETTVRIADAIAPEVVQYVEAHTEYAEFMYKLFEEFMGQKLGQIDPTIVGELSCLLMDRIYLKSSKLDT